MNYSVNNPTAIDLKQQFLRTQNISDKEHKKGASLLKKECNIQLQKIRPQTNAVKIA